MAQPQPGDDDWDDNDTSIDHYLRTRDVPSDLKCSRCRKMQPRAKFRLKAGKYNKTCIDCSAKSSATMEAVRRADRAAAIRQTEEDEGAEDRAHDDNNVEGIQQRAIALTWQRLRAMIKQTSSTNDSCVFEVTLEDLDNLSELETPVELSKALSLEIWKVTKYRWVYHDRRVWDSCQSKTTFRYHCAQDQEEMKARVQNPKRARNTMRRFDCTGWLQITVDSSNMRQITVRYRHRLDHAHYTDIAIPPSAQDYIAKNCKKTSSELYSQLRQDYHGRGMFFTRKQVYNHWCEVNKLAWRLHDDQFISARLNLDRPRTKGVDQVPLPTVQGYAFFLREVLVERGELIHEIGMDSTWKPNSDGYELYAFVAEAKGQALPLLFMFINADSIAPPHAKTSMLAAGLRYIAPQCPNIKFVLSDKDQSEINPIKEVMPEVKHQLCYWHVLRYLSDRLSENTTPMPYRAAEAYARFDFIDPDWYPTPLPPAQQHRRNLANPEGQNVQHVTLESAYAAAMEFQRQS